MQCPKCDNSTLKRGSLSAKKLKLDKCLQCKGIWFDKGELHTLLGNKAKQGFTIPKFSAETPHTVCPCCHVSLYEFCYPGTLILVDGCKQCEGVWLDDNEWQAIRHARDESNKITCPKCHTRQQPAESCSSCGIVIAKYNAPSPVAAKADLTKATASSKIHPSKEPSYAEDIPGLKGSLLRMIDTSISRLTKSLF